MAYLVVVAHKGLAFPRHVGLSWIRDRTYDPCLARGCFDHWTTWEVPPLPFYSTFCRPCILFKEFISIRQLLTTGPKNLYLERYTDEQEDMGTAFRCLIIFNNWFEEFIPLLSTSKVSTNLCIEWIPAKLVNSCEEIPFSHRSPLWYWKCISSWWEDLQWFNCLGTVAHWEIISL